MKEIDRERERKRDIAWGGRMLVQDPTRPQSIMTTQGRSQEFLRWQGGCAPCPFLLLLAPRHAHVYAFDPNFILFKPPLRGVRPSFLLFTPLTTGGVPKFGNRVFCQHFLMQSSPFNVGARNLEFPFGRVCDVFFVKYLIKQYITWKK